MCVEYNFVFIGLSRPGCQSRPDYTCDTWWLKGLWWHCTCIAAWCTPGRPETRWKGTDTFKRNVLESFAWGAHITHITHHFLTLSHSCLHLLPTVRIFNSICVFVFFLVGEVCICEMCVNWTKGVSVPRGLQHRYHSGGTTDCLQMS